MGIVVFSAAYTAENVRGGLQAIPPGQTEAGKALGLKNFHITSFIVLPQALRLVIPTLVGQFISLFKDTTLVYIVGINDLLGIGNAVLKWFDNFQALKGVSMEVMPGEVVVIFGPSGSGKSTFIRTLNRLEEHQRGTIIIHGIELSHDVRNIARVRR